MYIHFSKKITQPPLTLARKCGYIPWRGDRFSQREAFIRRMGVGFYPRFHLLYDFENGNLVFDLHFDWRRPLHHTGGRSYEGEESGTVREEAARIKKIVENVV